MTKFFERTEEERTLVRLAYDFEIMAIEQEDNSRNPYFDSIKALHDGEELWEAIYIAVELRYH